jgi:hypothetical protein
VAPATSASGNEEIRPLLTTGNSIQTWALEEARRRLEAEGILPDPDATKKGGS